MRMYCESLLRLLSLLLFVLELAKKKYPDM